MGLPKAPPTEAQSQDRNPGTKVYVIHEVDAPGVCKIGVAGDLAKRLMYLQCGTWRRLTIAFASEVPTKASAHAVERVVHQYLAVHHVRGEWFRVTPDHANQAVAEAIASLEAAFDVLDTQQ